MGNFTKNIRFLFKNKLKDLSEGRLSERAERLLAIKLMREMAKFKQPNILSYEDSIEYIVKDKLSVSRFGDGEITLMSGLNIPFQDYSEELVQRLNSIIHTEEKGFAIGIPKAHFDYSLMGLNPIGEKFIDEYMASNRDKWDAVINYNKTYIAAEITQIYQTFTKYNFAKCFEALKNIWRDRDIVGMECSKISSTIFLSALIV